MDNLLLSVIVGFLVIALLVFLIIKNRKDKKDLEESIRQNYPKPRHQSNDVENSEDQSI